MESPRAEAGRYLCAAGGHRMAEVARLLASRYAPFKPTERHVVVRLDRWVFHGF
jgi:hypothetical protein